MATRTWTLKIRGDSSDAVKAVDKIENRFKKLDVGKTTGSNLDKLSAKFKSLGSRAAATGRTIAKGLTIGAVAGFALLGTAAVAAFRGFEEHRKVMAKTTQVIKSMGSASWISAKGVEAMSDRLERQTGIDGDIIQNGANLLLTFKNIQNQAGKGNKIYDRTVVLANDMSVALGQDMKSSSIQLGKALNDPIKGLTALRRVGVSFTQQQQNQIKTMVESGDLLGAQRVILKELGSEFGGAAAAAASPWSRLRAIFFQVSDAIGEKIFPLVEKVAGVLADKLPAAVDKAKLVVRAFISAFQGEGITSTGIVGFAERLGVAARAAWPHVQRIGQAIADFAGRVRDFFKANPKVGFVVLATVIGGVLLGAVVALGAALIALISPFVLVVAAVAAVAGAVTYAYTRWGWFRGAVQAVTDWFQQTAVPTIRAVVDFIIAKFDQIAGWPGWAEIRTVVTVTFKVIAAVIAVFVMAAMGLWNRFGGQITTLVRAVFGAIWAIIRGSLNVIMGVINLVLAVITGHWGRAWDAIKQIVSGVWTAIGGQVRLGIAVVRFVLAAGINAVQGIWTHAWGAMRRVVSNVWDGIQSGVRHGINGVIHAINFFIRAIDHLPGVNIPTIDTLGGGGGGGTAQSRGGGGSLRMATGGMITNGPQYLVGEGNPAYPEAVIATDPRYRRRNQQLLAWAADKLGMPGFATGGIPGGGIVSGIGNVLSGAASAVSGFVRDMSVRTLAPVAGAAKALINHLPGPIGWLKRFGTGVVDMIYNWARGKASEHEQAGANAGFRGGGVERWRSVALQALRLAGAPASWIGSLLRRMMQESGGNPRAINLTDVNAQRGDPSRGLMQTIGSTFNAYAGAYRGRGIYDPLANIYAAIRYTVARYGSGPAGWDRAGGYRGGLQRVPRDNFPARLHKGEMVLTAREARAVRHGVDSGPTHVHHYHFGPGSVVVEKADKRGAKRFLDEIQRRSVMADSRIT